ncbi:DUF6124 family protein [Pseudomonas vanderleydeniana]|uniref:DUF3077 domain-containing protein n=1 Tax=Pseudomonas vanderleydeniana TaxID=2745495 RepID=A0A9E6PI48_9PSED|nr:DUF3077 domain-containing protein [Pseudomonas vanderleydeniana]QXI26822.1 DUF3077 domain-containing protein [Pseudomonas vanderleydeniana]
MTSSTKTQIDIDTTPTYDSLRDGPATRRALDYYLKPTVSSSIAEGSPYRISEDRLFTVRHNLSAEEAMIHASDLLRCAAATAYEAADALQGSSRDLAFSVVHMIDMAKAMVDRAVNMQYPAP